ncbi:hypothetical protein FA09DRAFT_329181 [Tilletiopsis washingtonensis]|uniref:Uncharacterized protein n=1 Tax=Tilletiopsis washingtonensis TaxID=58919 RepID=A0A316ZAU8_9BASI|nr:hypothetical protein FA09DRAFT_329181 [Tilletiopsis washingtonensis]PWN98669.1 hypothetical protein FA09DRAFT_329181 [Tilletiopsis washingtonensis]
MSSSRSATVHALSGRVQGLKFMQRATAAASRSAAEPASQDAPATPGPSRTPAVDSPQASTPAQQTQLAADDDEHWVLPSAGASGSATPSAARIQHEPAWDSWLLASTSASPAGAGSRRTFGSWARKKSAAAEQAAEEEEMDEQEREGMKIVEELKSEPVRRKSKEKKRSAALAVEDGSTLPPGFLKPGDAGSLRKSKKAKPSSPASSQLSSQEQARSAARERKERDMAGKQAKSRRKAGLAVRDGGEVGSDEDIDLDGWEGEV